jgi:lipid-binding SYLF domain-containing protein
MLFTRTVVAALCTLALALLPAVATAENAQTRRLQQVAEVLETFAGIPESAIPAALLDSAYGIAIIPNVIKVGFIVGARHGRGVLAVRGENGDWSNPAFITLTGGSLGWQIGGQSTDVILVFKSSRSIEGITSGKFTLGADASVAAGPVGRQTGAATDITFGAEVYSYSRNRGLFAGVAFEGASIQMDEAAARSFYGNDTLTAGDVLHNPALQSPPAARQFLETLNRVTPQSSSGVGARPAAGEPAVDGRRADDAEAWDERPANGARTFGLGDD